MPPFASPKITCRDSQAVAGFFVLLPVRILVFSKSWPDIGAAVAADAAGKLNSDPQTNVTRAVPLFLGLPLAVWRGSTIG